MSPAGPEASFALRHYKNSISLGSKGCTVSVLESHYKHLGLSKLRGPELWDKPTVDVDSIKMLPHRLHWI